MKLSLIALHLFALTGLPSSSVAFEGMAVSLNLDQARTETMFTGSAGMVGWTFYVTEPLFVDYLGWYDQGGDGLKQPHQVGLWKEMSGLPRDQLFTGLTNMTLLASVTLDSTNPRGPSECVIAGVGLTLEPGGYEIAGTFRPGAEDLIKAADLNGQPPVFVDPRIQLGAPTFYFGDDFRAPESGAQRYGVYLGPNFVVVMPEPGPLVLLLLASAIFGFRRFAGASLR